MSNEERLRRLFDAAPGLKRLANETLIKTAMPLNLDAEESAALSAILFERIGNETLIKIADILNDQGSDYDAGELAAIGATLEGLGKIVKEFARLKARRQMGYAKKYSSQGVNFEFRPSRTYQRLDAKAVRERFPVERHPDLYRESTTREQVWVRVPNREKPTMEVDWRDLYDE